MVGHFQTHHRSFSSRAWSRRRACRPGHPSRRRATRSRRRGPLRSRSCTGSSGRRSRSPLASWAWHARPVARSCERSLPPAIEPYQGRRSDVRTTLTALPRPVLAHGRPRPLAPVLLRRLASAALTPEGRFGRRSDVTTTLTALPRPVLAHGRPRPLAPVLLRRLASAALTPEGEGPSPVPTSAGFPHTPATQCWTRTAASYTGATARSWAMTRSSLSDGRPSRVCAARSVRGWMIRVRIWRPSPPCCPATIGHRGAATVPSPPTAAASDAHDGPLRPLRANRRRVIPSRALSGRRGGRAPGVRGGCEGALGTRGAASDELDRVLVAEGGVEGTRHVDIVAMGAAGHR